MSALLIFGIILFGLSVWGIFIFGISIYIPIIILLLTCYVPLWSQVKNKNEALDKASKYIKRLEEENSDYKHYTEVLINDPAIKATIRRLSVSAVSDSTSHDM